MAVDTRYRPPTKVVSTSVPLKTIVVRADPDFERQTRREPFYEFTSRSFFGNNASAGAYAPDSNPPGPPDPVPPTGFLFLAGTDGAILTGSDGAMLYGAA